MSLENKRFMHGLLQKLTASLQINLLHLTDPWNHLARQGVKTNARIPRETRFFKLFDCHVFPVHARFHWEIDFWCTDLCAAFRLRCKFTWSTRSDMAPPEHIGSIKKQITNTMLVISRKSTLKTRKLSTPARPLDNTTSPGPILLWKLNALHLIWNGASAQRAAPGKAEKNVDVSWLRTWLLSCLNCQCFWDMQTCHWKTKLLCTAFCTVWQPCCKLICSSLLIQGTT